MSQVIEVKSKNRRIAIIIIVCFIIIISIVPIIQLLYELSFDKALQEFDLFKRTPTVANLRSYEDTLEDNSVVAKTIRPWYQWVSTFLINQGNAEAVIGKDGWLFYRPSLDYIISPEENFYREFGPKAVIIAFNETLKEQDVQLILLPMPGKASIYPEYLSDRYDESLGPPVNPHAPEFFQMLRSKGIHVFDPADILWQGKVESQVYLTQDTHWSPDGLKLVANHLAELIKTKNWFTSDKSYYLQSYQVKRYGDIYDMLNLPDVKGSYNPWEIIVEKVIDSDTGKPFEPDQSSPIVLLGDSFVNIYSHKEMGWGENSGFGEHLADQLGASLDIIAINDGGPTTTRETLARRPDALVGKKLVIWQFATRDLTKMDSQWKIVDIPMPKIQPQPEKPVVEEDDSTVVKAEVLIVSNVPDPNQVAYSECLTYIKYRVILVEQGSYNGEELLAVFWGMKSSKLMPPASFKVGQRHRLVIEPFDEHPELSHIMQADDTEDYENIPMWVVEYSSIDENE
ncbi:hypothetical protein GF312_00245 [Candidatus Poribacteria bacterium]|nr:hypothetical protein [Candidatus Poribacteria bacterium]